VVGNGQSDLKEAQSPNLNVSGASIGETTRAVVVNGQSDLEESQSHNLNVSSASIGETTRAVVVNGQSDLKEAQSHNLNVSGGAIGETTRYVSFKPTPDTFEQVHMTIFQNNFISLQNRNTIDTYLFTVDPLYEGVKEATTSVRNNF